MRAFKALVFSCLGIAVLLFAACNQRPPAGGASPTITSPPVTDQPSGTEPVPIPPEPTGTISPTLPPTDTVPPPTPNPTIEADQAGPPIQPLEAGEVVNIIGIHMVDEQSGWGIGDAGGIEDHILRTSDGGLIWRDVSPPETASASDSDGKRALAFFLSSDNAWVTYYPHKTYQFEPSYVWLTSDGGETWGKSSQLDGSGLDTFFEPGFLYFVNERFGWLMLGHDRGMGHAPVSIYHTGDGGHNWDRVLDPYSDQSGYLHTCCQTGMVFIDSQTGLITSNGGPVSFAYVDWTFDGGGSWDEQELPPADSELFARAWCGTVSPVVVPPHSVALVVECVEDSLPAGLNTPFLYTSDDRGQTWSYFEMPVAPLPEGSLDYVRRAHQVQFLNQEIGWAIVYDLYQSHGEDGAKSLTHIYQTRDGGRNWSGIKTVSWDGQFSFVNAQDGWAAAHSEEENALVQTINAGRTWKILESQIGP